MRKTRIGAFVASTALASATILGGTGVASAGSLDLGSLGSSGEAEAKPGVTLTLDEAGIDGANGTLSAEGVDGDLEGCFIGITEASIVENIQKKYEAGEITDLSFTSADLWAHEDLQAANAAGKNTVALVDVDEGETTGWTAPAPGTDEDYRAGAWVTCDGGDDALVDFAYEPAEPVGSIEGFIGSIDFGGSLGSLSGS